MRVVALVPGGIGDQILFFPTLDSLKQAYPHAEIDVFVEPRAKLAYRVCRSVHETLIFNWADRNSLADWGNLLGMLRDREYEVAIAAGQYSGLGLLLWLTGIPTRIGYSNQNPLFFTRTVPLKPEQYAPAVYHDLLQGLGIQTPCPDLAINVPQKDIEWAEAEQKRLGITSGYLLIHGGPASLNHPQAGDRRYPLDHWKAIIQRLQQQPNLPVVVAQNPDDPDFTRVLAQACPHLKVIAPEDIGKLAAVVASANLLLAVDCIAMHLAVAVKTYTIGLFGPTNPNQRLPQSDRFVAIQSPTGNMADISPQTVLNKILGG